MVYLHRYALAVLLATLLVSCSKKEKESSPESQANNEAGYVEKAHFATFQGDTVRVSDFKGKVVLIDFWETWCKPCLAIFPTMQRLLEEYPDDFAVLAVNPGFADSREDAKDFKEDHEYDFHYLFDSGNLSGKLKVQSIPFKVYVDAQGNYIKSSVGSYGEDEDYKQLKEIIEKHKMKKAGAGE